MSASELSLEKRNGQIFFFSNILTYFAAPLIYVGVVQAGLCDKLGASPSVSNLPNSAYLAGFLAPIILSWLIPQHRERAVVVVTHWMMAGSLALVGIALLAPVDNSIRIAAVIGQGLIVGLCISSADVYILQCLKRGTTDAGISRTFTLTFSLGPIAAVAGSLLAQLLLGGGYVRLGFPDDFAVLYLAAVPCLMAVALLSRGYRSLTTIAEDRPEWFGRYIGQALREYFKTAALGLTLVAYLFFCFGTEAMSNISLYTKEALKRDPKEFAGLMMALRFGFKGIAGYFLGRLAERRGMKAAVIGTLLLLGAGMLWAGFVTGYSFLFTFAFFGAAELGAVYFRGYVLTVSSAAASARNLSILTLASFGAALAPVAHGTLTEWWGFKASFTLGGLVCLAGLGLALILPSNSVKIPNLENI